MLKRRIMKVFLVVGIILIIWLILAQSCMTFRIADADAKQKFSDKGLTLTTNTIEVEKHHIHYAQTGIDTFPTIFFLHGTPGSWDAFSGYLQDSLLLQKFRLISIDRPGFGNSDYGKPENLARQSQLISPLFKQLQNGKPYFLAGHSLGGPMVIKLAADNENMFSGIVVISGSIDPEEEKPERWRPVLFETPLNYFIPGAMRPSNKELWYLKKDLILLQQDFKKIVCPVYFIHGLKDTWVPPGNVEYGKKLLVNAPEVGELMIPGANHFIPWTKFKEIRDVLLYLH